MEIMFDDLIPEAQKRLLKETDVSAPEDMNWDIYPVVIVDFKEDTHKLDVDDFTEDFFNYGYGYGEDEL